MTRFDYRVVGAIGRCQQTARRARRAVCGIVRVVDARPRGFDVRPGVRAESPFQHRGECQNHLNSDQQTDRRLPDCR